MQARPTKEDIDAAVRHVLEKALKTEPWAKWARRWVHGIDRTLRYAREAAAYNDDVAGIRSAAAEAAIEWLEAQRLPEGNAERAIRLSRAWQFCCHAIGAAP